MKIITLTGPSCSGKTTLLNNLVDNHGYVSIVSHTTRPPRPGEQEGKDYYFISQSDFDALSRSGGFMESINFNGYSYGVSAAEMARVTMDGKTAVLIVEPHGLMQIRKYCAAHKIWLYSIYISGHLSTLMTRYIKRLAGEDLGQQSIAKRHATRISSLIEEHMEWCKYTDIYDQSLESFELENTEETINMIKQITETQLNG